MSKYPPFWLLHLLPKPSRGAGFEVGSPEEDARGARGGGEAIVRHGGRERLGEGEEADGDDAGGDAVEQRRDAQREATHLRPERSLGDWEAGGGVARQPEHAARAA